MFLNFEYYFKTNIFLALQFIYFPREIFIIDKIHLHLDLNSIFCFIFEYNILGSDEPFYEFPGLLFLSSEGI